MANSSNDLDTQPEQDIPPAQVVSLSMGLVLGSGLILGALIGALIGHFLLDNAFGFGHDIAVGALVGAAIAAIVSITTVKTLSSRVAKRNMDRS